MALFNKDARSNNKEIFFGIVKSGTNADRVGVIDEGANGETVGCFAKDGNGIEKLAEIKVNINVPKKFEPKKLELKLVADGKTVEARDLKGFRPNETFVSAFYEGKPVGCELSAKLLELCFPEAQQSAPASAPASSSAASSGVAAPVTAASVDDDQEFEGDLILFYHAGQSDEQIVNTVGEAKFWLRNLELGLVKEDDFAYRAIVEVMGGIKIASPEPVNVPFKVGNLKQVLGR